jgi:hypothetical protein
MNREGSMVSRKSWKSAISSIWKGRQPPTALLPRPWNVWRAHCPFTGQNVSLLPTITVSSTSPPINQGPVAWITLAISPTIFASTPKLWF